MEKLIERLADLATIVVAVSAIVVTGIVVSRERAPDSAASRPVRAIVEDWEPFAEDGHRLGPADAPVTIIEFGDYQCPFCRSAETHLAAIRRQYGDQVALVYRHYPLDGHAAAYPAAKAAECAGQQEAFWAYHDLLFARLGWQTGNTVEALVDLGEEAGLESSDDFRACLENDEPVPDLIADREAAFALGVSGTPTFIVNGRIYVGVLDSIFFGELYKELRN